MKILILAAVILGSSGVAFAQDFDFGTSSGTKQSWQCEATGLDPVGGAGGGWRSIYGSGDTVEAASAAAMSNCGSQGFIQCTPGVCRQR